MGGGWHGAGGWHDKAAAGTVRKLAWRRLARCRVARNLRFCAIRPRLGRARVRRRGHRLVGLAPRLGVERFRLGVGCRRLGMGRSAGGRVVRPDRRSAADRGTPADLHRASADRARTSGDRSAADCGRPPATGRCSSRGRGPAAAYRRACSVRRCHHRSWSCRRPPIVVAAAPPLVIFAPPAFALFIGPPVLAFATIGPGWWHGGFITGGFGAVGATAAIAHFGHRGFAGGPVGFHGRTWGPSRSAWGGRGLAGWHGGGFGGWHGGGGWHEARMGGGGFGGGHGRWR